MIPRLSISTLFPYTTLFRSRFINCIDILTDEEDQFIPMSTSHYFNFSSQFKKKYLPYAIELGRSWVQPMYQPSVNPRKGLFALDNLWDGLGVLTVIYQIGRAHV